MKNDYYIENGIAYVTLTQGQVCKVDEADLPLIEKYRWCALKHHNTYYAIHSPKSGQVVYMHRVINQTPGGLSTDHIDGDGLNNRRGNLRTVTSQQNQSNQKRPPNPVSGYRGVRWDRGKGMWLATIGHGGKVRKVGHFEIKEHAAAAYNAAARELRGTFAHERTLNWYSGSVL